MSLYDRIFRPRRYTLSDGTVVMEKRSRAPLVILILVVLTAVSVRITGFNFSVLVLARCLPFRLPSPRQATL